MNAPGLRVVATAAAKLFAIMTLPVADVNAQNDRMQQGEMSSAQIQQHVDSWINAHRAQFDGWIATARAAAK